MNLVLLGAPGTGKGTQSDFLREKYGFDYISTGAILREAIASGTPLGLQAKARIDAGHLASDDVVISIVKEKIKDGTNKIGYIFDGFPRNIFQAEELSKIITIDYALLINVPDEVIELRMANRRVCPTCDKSFQLGGNIADDATVCPKCGGELEKRRDDCPEVVKERLKVYHATTEPVADYYRARNMLKEIDGTGPISKSTAAVVKVLGLEQR